MQFLTDNSQRFPCLSQLASACCTIFHGNADIERVFGKSSDIDASGKRGSLSGEIFIAKLNSSFPVMFYVFLLLR